MYVPTLVVCVSYLFDEEKMSIVCSASRLALLWGNGHYTMAYVSKYILFSNCLAVLSLAIEQAITSHRVYE